MRLIVKSDGSVLLVAHPGIPKKICLDFAESHKEWIANKKRQMHRHHESVNDLIRSKKGEFLLFGEWVPLHIDATTRCEGLCDSRLMLRKKERLKKVIREMLESKLSALCERKAEEMGARYQKVSIRKTRHRWGSCSADSKLSFSLMLATAPEHVIEYLVVHELSHVLHKNHGRRFWEMVARYKPDYEEQETWIKQYHPLSAALIKSL